MYRPANKIFDEFTDLPICHQDKYQLRRKKEGLCVICGDKAVNRNHCRKHARYKASLANKNYIHIKPLIFKMKTWYHCKSAREDNTVTARIGTAEINTIYLALNDYKKKVRKKIMSLENTLGDEYHDTCEEGERIDHLMNTLLIYPQ